MPVTKKARKMVQDLNAGSGPSPIAEAEKRN
jgi:hypothetical protein